MPCWNKWLICESLIFKPWVLRVHRINALLWAWWIVYTGINLTVIPKRKLVQGIWKRRIDLAIVYLRHIINPLFILHSHCCHVWLKWTFNFIFLLYCIGICSIQLSAGDLQYERSAQWWALHNQSHRHVQHGQQLHKLGLDQ